MKENVHSDTAPASDASMVTKLLFRLLPLQIILAGISSINGMVSGLFASNFIGEQAMSAVALYGPINMLIGALSFMLFTGATVLCGSYLGRNQPEKLQNLFALDLVLATLISALFVLVLAIIGSFDLSGFLARDAAVRPHFNRYLLGQAIGVLPYFLSNQLSAFLSMENQVRRTTTASLLLVASNILLNILFVTLLHWGAFGLGLASSLSLWVFLLAEAQYFISPRASLRFHFGSLPWGESAALVKIGFPGAATFVYQTARGLLVNALITLYVGSAGLSAFAASDAVLRLFWAIPGGMTAVSRMLISVSIGEEDRQTLTDVMRNMFRRFLPLMSGAALLIILLAVPFTRLFYRDAAAPVYGMTVWGFRLLPLCYPLSLVCMHFTCYWQASNRQGVVHLLSVLDGVVCVAGFTALLIPRMGMNSVYAANVLNGVVTTAVIWGYAWLKNRRFPRNLEQLMVIPDSFGVSEADRLDLSVRSMEEVVTVAEQVQAFCMEKGLDARRSTLAGLCMEEMAGNVVDHGFRKDRKQHTVDVRVVYKDNGVILRIKDDCIPFDPAERQKLAMPEDPSKGIGIRMVYRIASDVTYQNILGLNVLTIRI